MKFKVSPNVSSYVEIIGWLFIKASHLIFQEKYQWKVEHILFRYIAFETKLNLKTLTDESNGMTFISRNYQVIQLLYT